MKSDSGMKQDTQSVSSGSAPVNSFDRCEWQECDAYAVICRNTPWGDLLVCATHYHTPLVDERDLAFGEKARR